VRFRLVSYNIRRGGIGRSAALAGVITEREPDLVLLQEATHPPTVERLAREAALVECGSRPGVSVAFLSRHPVRSSTWSRPRWARHAFLQLDLDGLTVFGVHLSAVHSNWTERRRLFELRALMSYVQTVQHGRHILAGDFNTLAAGESLDLGRLPARLRMLAWLTGPRIRWQTIHELLKADYLDAFRHVHRDAPGYTFPTWDPHLRLDYAFVPQSSAAMVVGCDVGISQAAAAASDHFPLIVDLNL
jgi:endonuclease/exonuclease/phosphatase family metal-dependent hydrolase